MSDEKRKQLRLTALLVVLICLFTFGGFWFRGNPLFTGQGLRIGSKADAPVATYEPYQSSFASTFGSLVSGLTGQEAAPAAAMSRFYTTKRAVVFTFSGLGSEQELRSVLDALERTNSRATFFVSAEDLERRLDQVDAIHNAGQRLGICLPPPGTAAAHRSCWRRCGHRRKRSLRAIRSLTRSLSVPPTVKAAAPSCRRPPRAASAW